MCVAFALADFPARHFQYAASFCVWVCGTGKGQREALSKHWSGPCLHVRLAWHKQTKIANTHALTRTLTYTQWETEPYYCFALVVPPTPTRSASNVCESQLQCPPLSLPSSPLPAPPQGLEVAVVVIARADADNVIKNSFKANVPACLCVCMCVYMWVSICVDKGQKDAFDFDTYAWKKQCRHLFFHSIRFN